MRTPREESILLPFGSKVQIIVASGLHRVLGSLELEEALAFVLLFVAVLLFTINRRRLGAVSVVSAMMALTYLAPPANLALGRYGLSPVARPPGLSHPILRGQLRTTADGSFVDEHNRTVLLRGANVGGSAKTPFGWGTHVRANDSFYIATPSFVDRPLPLAQADTHFARLASWGLGVARLLVTWEAIEPQPGRYDEAYVAYVVALVRAAARHNVSVFVDPHQDVWSRWTGGDGAPRWTLEKVGFKVGPELFASGAAFMHQEVHAGPLPRMTWPTNYARLATATMFTLFFAGDVYAPNTFIEGRSAQDYLQSHYVAAIAHLARALEGEANVLGFDTLNEPSPGYVGVRDARASLFPAPAGQFMSVFDGMVLGAGFARRVDVFEPALVYSESVLMNPKGVSAWTLPELDVWRANGVWDVVDGKPKLLRPDHFALPKGAASFQALFMVPFFNRVARALPASFIVFLEPHIDLAASTHVLAPALHELDLGAGAGVGVGGGTGARQVAFAPHFYDAFVLMTKTFRPWIALDVASRLPVFGPWIQSSFARWARELRHAGKAMPVLLGETGIAMDLDLRRAYTTGDFSLQVLAMDRTLRALDSAGLSYTLWNYCFDNSNRNGDNWNGEDLSLWSRDQVTDDSDLNSGGRALPAVVRPYAARVAGVALEMSFDVVTRRFFVKVAVDPALGRRESLLFLPHYQYPGGRVETAVGSRCGEGQTLARVGEQLWAWKHGGQSGGKGGACVEWVEIAPQLVGV